ncbi:MAG: glycoside hydrolase family 20 zincin-like fold domain-containing protein, partial [Mangrovibacterium sp.]|nr:glycoside hydrolase family 20 zincin-like fold domain-containing protein [Mangrovibacterium sp.]
MKKCNQYLVIFSFLLGACHVTPPIELVSNGKSEYAIVIPSDPNKQEQRAAALFQDYIQQVSGCSLAVAHHPEEGSKAVFIREKGNILHDGYRIKTDKNGSISIDGSKNKGCIYGVITILEKYVGCHLYTPDYKIIPQNKDIRLPYMDLADSSVNENRMINIPDK